MQLTVIQSKIHTIRGERVILDFDIFELYQVETKILNQAVKRNIDRFPIDFMFQLTETEWDNLRSQFVTSSWGGMPLQNMALPCWPAC
ncbi:MAG: ORF6N domain-containing protein [Agriterribacter sp.]